MRLCFGQWCIPWIGRKNVTPSSTLNANEDNNNRDRCRNGALTTTAVDHQRNPPMTRATLPSDATSAGTSTIFTHVLVLFLNITMVNNRVQSFHHNSVNVIRPKRKSLTFQSLYTPHPHSDYNIVFCMWFTTIDVVGDNAPRSQTRGYYVRRPTNTSV